MDETNVEAAMLSPDDYRAQMGDLQPTSGGVLKFQLLPYAIVRIDVD
jgi:hypothetical protein